MKKNSILNSIQSFEKKTLPLYFLQKIHPTDYIMDFFYSKKHGCFVISSSYYKPISKI